LVVRGKSHYNSADLVAWTLCAASAVFGTWALQVGWHDGILDLHAWRQTHTAISAYEMTRGGPFWHYRTPIFGPPWQWPLELPVYQWLTARVCQWMSVGLEAAGRGVSVAAFIGALAAGWATLDVFSIARRHRPIVLSLLWTSPLYIFWSRAFLVESTALCLAVAYVALVHQATWRGELDRGAVGFLIGAAATGALAGATKVTTLTPFLAAAGLLMVVRRRRDGWTSTLTTWTAIGAIVVPIALTAAWLMFTDHVKAGNPLTAELGWADESARRFGSLADRFSLRSWIVVPANAILGRTRHTVIGSGVVFCAAFAATIGRPLRFALCLACLALYVLPIAVFMRLFTVHVYYSYENGLLLAAIVGCGIVSCLEGGRVARWAGVALYAGALAAMSTNYLQGYYADQKSATTAPMALAVLTDERTSPDDVMLIYGLDYSPVLPYEARRRAIMDWKNRDLDDPAIHSTLEELSAQGLRLGAVVACGDARTNVVVLANIARLGYPHAPAHTEPFCDLYLK
jgi:hypothetical protein